MRLLLRPSSIALLTASAFVFVGLYVAERSLSRSERENVQADAKESAAVASAYMSVRVEGLHALRSFYLDDDASTLPPDSAHFVRLVDALYGAGDGLRSIWLIAPDGRVLRQRYYGEADASYVLGIDVDTISYLAFGATAARARQSRQPAVSQPGRLIGSDSGVVVLDPLVVDGVFQGFGAGTVSLKQLRDLFAERAGPQRRTGLALLADSLGRDTVIGFSRNSGVGRNTRIAMAPVELPGGERWWVAIRYGARSPIRLQLWGVALAAIGALGLGIWHERRQTRRIADRSLELERLSTELLQANRAKSEFLANVSHELRTPLNAIVGFTELLRDGVYGELAPRQAGPVGRIEASAAHLRELVDQVLDLARITAGRLEVNTETVELRQFVLDVATEVEPLLTEKGLTLSLDIGAGTPRLRTDPSYLRQILLNLLANAVNYTEEGGVTVRTGVVTSTAAGGVGGGVAGAPAVRGVRGALEAATGSVAPLRRAHSQSPDPTASWVTIQVCDTGFGVAPRDQERIFDEFEQLSAGSRGSGARQGTGLGLPISRRLAQLLGGDLRVESEVGRGSTFTVWLPGYRTIS